MLESTRTGLRSTVIDHHTRPKAWVDVAKGGAMFLVVLFHTALYFGEADITGIPGRLKQFLEAFPMPAFFLIAGLFASRMSTWTFAQLWKRRLVPLLWLYVVWSLVRFVFYLVVPGTNGDLGALAATDPRSIALLLVWPSNSYWFLYALFWFTFGVWALRRVPTWLTLGLALALGAAITSGLISAENLGWNRIGALFFFFLVGALFSQRIISAVAAARPRTAIVLPLVYLAVSLLVVVVPGARHIPGGVTAMQLLALATGFVLCRYLAMVRPIAVVLRTIGEWSLQIYLLHIFIIVSMAALLAWILPPTGGALGALLITVCAVATTYLAVLISTLTTRARWLYVPPRAWLRTRPKKDATA